MSATLLCLVLLSACPESERPRAVVGERPTVAPTRAPPHWVARCTEAACADFDPEGFDPLGLSPAEPSGLLLEVQGPGELTVTIDLGAGRCGCDDCDASALPGPRTLTRTWTLERGRSVVDVAPMVDDWSVQSIDAVASLDGTASRVQAKGWALCM